MYAFSDPSFHSIVASGNLERVRTEIDCGAAVNAVNAQNETPLHVAVENGFEGVVRLLLEKGSRPQPDKSNFEPLHIACFKQSPTIVELLLNARTQLKLSNPQPLLIALLIAAQNGDQKIVLLLLSAGANPNVFLKFPFSHHRLPFSVSFGSFPLHLACQQGHLGIVKLLSEHKAEKNCSRYIDSYKPLHLAAENNHTEVVDYLLKNGVDPNVKANENLTALHLAAKAGFVKVVELLLRHGASVSSQTSKSLTPLLFAVKHEREEVVRMLLECGASVNDRDENNNTLLFFAFEKRNLHLINCILKYNPLLDDEINKSVRRIVLHEDKYSAVVDALIEYGVTIKREDVRDLLLPAVIKGYTKIVEYLLANVVDPNDKRYNSVLLHNAVKNGNSEIVKLLLKAGFDANAKDKSGNTPIFYLLCRNKMSKHLEMIKLMLSSGAKIKEAPELLHKAVDQENVELCRYLIEIGAEVNALDRQNKAPLHHCAPEIIREYRKRSFTKAVDGVIRGEIAKLLLKNGADVDLTTNDGSTTLHLAIKNGWLELIRILLEFKANVNMKDGNLCSPLDIAAMERLRDVTDRTRRVEAIQLLLSSGANGKEVPELLHKAVDDQSVELCRFLIEIGTDVNAVDEEGETPLHHTALGMYRDFVHSWYQDRSFESEDDGVVRGEIARLLLNNGANINSLTDCGSTTLHIAVRNGWLEVVLVLLEFKANFNILNDSFRSPLHIAALNGKTDIAESLLKNGADVEAPLGEGARRPLHIAAYRGHTQIVKLLLQFDANINAQDSGGNTALHSAIRGNRRKVVMVLLENDCDVNIRGRSGNTALGLILENFVDSDSDFPDIYRDSLVYDSNSDSEDSWDHSRDYDDNRISKKIINFVTEHGMKLRAAGLFISKWNEHLIEWAYGDEDEKLEHFFRECEEEVGRMKGKKICSHITFYNVLVNPINPAFARNKSAISSLESLDLSEFPIYRSLLVHRSKVNREMNQFYGSGKEWLSILIKTRNVLNQKQLPTLPVELFEEIVLYLSKIDLKCLISCGEDLKRQLCE